MPKTRLLLAGTIVGEDGDQRLVAVLREIMSECCGHILGASSGHRLVPKHCQRLLASRTFLHKRRVRFIEYDESRGEQSRLVREDGEQ